MCLSLVKKMRNIEKFRTFADYKKKTTTKNTKKTKNKNRNKNTQKLPKISKSILKTRIGLKRLIFLMF